LKTTFNAFQITHQRKNKPISVAYEHTDTSSELGIITEQISGTNEMQHFFSTNRFPYGAIPTTDIETGDKSFTLSIESKNPLDSGIPIKAHVNSLLRHHDRSCGRWHINESDSKSIISN
jgi:hypothetical protein